MKWRRRVFAFSLVFGAGVLSFGPVLSHSISRRISMQWDADAQVESSKLSLQNSSITLSGLSVDHSDFTLTGGQVYLKFNPERLWYRDCVIDSLVAKDIRWRLLEEGYGSTLPSVKPSEIVSHTLTQMEAFSQHCAERQATFDQKLVKLSNRIHSAGGEATRKNQRIEQIFESLVTEVEGLQNPDSQENPLRSSRRLESIRGKAQEIEKLLAEERLLGINTQQSLETELQSLNKASSESGANEFRIHLNAPQLSREIASAMLDNAAASLVPYAKAGHLANVSLLTNSKIPQSDLHRPTPVDSFASSSFGVDVLFPEIRPRITKINQGRIYGQSEIAGRHEEFEIHLLTTQKSFLNNSGKVNIYWRNLNSPDMNSSSKNSSSMTQAFITVNQERDGVEKNSLQILREDVSGQSTLNISHVSGNIQSATTASIRTLHQIPGLDSIGLDCSSFIERNPHLTFHGTTSGSLLDSAREPSAWNVADSELKVIQDWLTEELKGLTSNRMLDLNQSMRQRVEHESAVLKLKAQSLETEIRARQENWNRLLAAKMQLAREWESQQMRSFTLP